MAAVCSQIKFKHTLCCEILTLSTRPEFSAARRWLSTSFRDFTLHSCCSSSSKHSFFSSSIMSWFFSSWFSCSITFLLSSSSWQLRHTHMVTQTSQLRHNHNVTCSHTTKTQTVTQNLTTEPHCHGDINFANEIYTLMVTKTSQLRQNHKVTSSHTTETQNLQLRHTHNFILTLPKCLPCLLATVHT